MKAVRDAFEAARNDDGRIEDAMAVVETFLADAPGHPVAMAYQGGLHALKAAASALPWVKLRHANAAAALLDRAWSEAGRLAADSADRPPDLEIQLLRGIAYAHFPPFLGRAELARQCLDAARAHAAFAAVPTLYRGLAHAHLAVLCHRERQPETALGHLEHALQTDAGAADRIWAAR